MGLYINIGNEGFRAALNGEYSLACVLVLAYYAAQDKFAIVRELPTGKGFADIVLIPQRPTIRMINDITKRTGNQHYLSFHDLTKMALKRNN